MNCSKTSISLEKAEKMRAAYSAADTGHSNGGPNTRGIWFSLEDLTTLVEKLNKYKDTLNIDGARFYLAKYTADNMDELDDKKYNGYITLVHVPTVTKGNAHIDYVDEENGLTYENRSYICPPHTDCEEDSDKN